MNPAIQTQSITVKANAVTPISVSGSYVLFTSNTGPFKFSIDGGPMQIGLAILGIDVTKDPSLPALPPGVPPVIRQFHEIILQDTSGSPNTINFIVANAAVTYVNPNATYFQKDAPTYGKDSDIIALAAITWSASFTGVDTGGQTRKHFTVSNLDTALPLYIGDGVKPGMLVPANQSRIQAVSGARKIFNPSVTTPVNFMVSEAFYV